VARQVNLPFANSNRKYVLACPTNKGWMGEQAKMKREPPPPGELRSQLGGSEVNEGGGGADKRTTPRSQTEYSMFLLSGSSIQL
jgi:hypothetical protein